MKRTNRFSNYLYIKRFLISAAIFCFTVGANRVFAQDKVELPDLTTIIAASEVEESVARVPDFKDVVTIPLTTGSLIPELPEIEILENNEPLVSVAEEIENQVYAEGQIGGGYPVAFIGDFCISRIYGSNPFKISFTHHSKAGFAQKKLSEGYNSHNTLIGLEKEIAIKNFVMKLDGLYEDRKNGLQCNVDSVSAVSQDTIGAGAVFDLSLPYNFSIGGNLDSDFYYRFYDFTKISEDFEIPDTTSIFYLNPSLYGNWNWNGFYTALRGDYYLSLNATDSEDTLNRGYFGAEFSWENELIKLYAQSGFVICDRVHLNYNRFIAPFSLGMEGAFPVYFSDRRLSLKLEGGLSSQMTKADELEKKYKFSGFTALPAETSDWYGTFNLNLPLKTAFSAGINLDYKNTALHNGVWQPVYDENHFVYGMYSFEKSERQLLTTDLEMTFRHNIFAFSTKYHANWLDVPVLENKHNFSLAASCQNLLGTKGASLNIDYSIDAEDKTPYIDMSGFIQVTPTVKFVLSVDDLIKLIDYKNPRLYAGNYISDTGSVTLIVKFLF
ncbi:MAG: hypothetical protein MJ188_03885 [Treponema sp.]|nr:hypothetical protein [Treponema sp.]